MATVSDTPMSPDPGGSLPNGQILREPAEFMALG
jgi:hypothetical protein